MMLRGSARQTPAEQLSYARGMLNFLHETVRAGGALKAALGEVKPIVDGSSDYYLIHEFLEPFNSPCYFKDFIEKAAQNGTEGAGGRQAPVLIFLIA